MKICEDPEVLNIISIFKTLLTILSIGVTVVLIIFIMIDIIKMIVSSDADSKKLTKNFSRRIIACAIVFLVPAIINTVFSLVGGTLDYQNCLANANDEYIGEAYAAKASELLALAEERVNPDNLGKAKRYIEKVANPTLKANMQNRLEAVQEYIREMQKEDPSDIYKPIGGSSSGSEQYGKYEVGGVYSNGNGSSNVSSGQLSSEPDPSSVINYWDNKGLISASNFFYPKDQSTGLSLGAWPKKYESIPTSIAYTKTYLNGNVIFPIDVANGKFGGSYEHKGIDFTAYIGTPIYSPVDGTLSYSEWGHTSNQRGDETAYSVGIIVDKPFSYDGKTIDRVFLTHLCGIRYRCNSTTTCNRKVKKGELLGFSGNASSTFGAAAPHLHMSLYNKSSYSSTNVMTTQIMALYNLKVGDSIKAGG